MRRYGLVIAAAAATIIGWSCGGSGSSSPSSPSAAPASPVTITIVGSSGTAAFQPNPLTGVSSGATVVFRNSDTISHHIVMDDGSGDLGLLAPGQSGTIAVGGSAGKFHCTIHPSMVGAINAPAPSAPPCNTPGYC